MTKQKSAIMLCSSLVLAVALPQAGCHFRRPAQAGDGAADLSTVDSAGDLVHTSDLERPDAAPPLADLTPPDVVLPPACSPWAAAGTGKCNTLLGYRFDGVLCRAVRGCTCSGPHCSALYKALPKCLQAQKGCRSCAPLEAKGVGLCNMELGHTWTGEACLALNGCSCAGAGCKRLLPTKAACVAAYKSCPSCAPMDATEWGICEAEFGYKWDGAKCALVNCNCKGTDCTAVADVRPAECQAYHAHCATLPVP